MLVRELGRGGYQATSERVDTPEALHSALATQSWDLMITDYTMPRFSGLGALKMLKQTGIDIPFVMVSGSIGEETAVEVIALVGHYSTIRFVANTFQIPKPEGSQTF